MRTEDQGLQGAQGTGTEGQGQPSGEYEFSDWELANKLRPPAEMSRLERLQEWRLSSPLIILISWRRIKEFAWRPARGCELY